MAANVAINDTDTATTGISVAKVSQEGKNHDDHQQYREDQGPLDVAQRCANGRRTVDRQSDVDGRRNRRPQLGYQPLHQIEGTDDVGARLPVENDQDGWFAVRETCVTEILDRVGHVTDVGEMNRRAISVGQDQGFVVVGLVGLVIGIDLKTLVLDVDPALRAVRIGAGYCSPHVLKTDAILV